MTTKIKALDPMDLATTTATAEPETSLVAPREYTPSGIEGEIDSADFSLCYLSLCQKSGALADDFKPGNFVFAKSIDLGTSISVIPVRAAKFYEEDAPFGEGNGQVWNKRSEIPSGQPVREAANVDFLVQIDQPVSALSVTVDGKTFACGRFVVRKSSYSVFKTLVTDTAGFLRDGLYTGQYTMTSEKRSNDKNSWYVPQLRADGKVSPELIAEIKSVLHI